MVRINSLFWIPDKEDVIPLGDHLAVRCQGLVWRTPLSVLGLYCQVSCLIVKPGPSHSCQLCGRGQVEGSPGMQWIWLLFLFLSAFIWSLLIWPLFILPLLIWQFFIQGKVHKKILVLGGWMSVKNTIFCFFFLQIFWTIQNDSFSLSQQFLDHLA